MDASPALGNIYRHQSSPQVVLRIVRTYEGYVLGTLKIGDLVAGSLRVANAHLRRDWIILQRGRG